MAIYSGFTHWKWWFSITMLNYQRVLWDSKSNTLSTSSNVEESPRTCLSCPWVSCSSQKKVLFEHTRWALQSFGLCIHMYSYVFICIHMYSYVFICIHMYSYVFICIHMYSYVFICIHMYSYVFICFHMFSYVFICIHMYSYVFICIHMYSIYLWAGVICFWKTTIVIGTVWN